MLELTETIDVPRPAREVFAYVSDFTTSVEWSASTRQASQSTPGAIAPGTEFQVRRALPAGSVDLRYEVTSLEPEHRIDLHGRCRLFEVRESFRCTPAGDGTRIDYSARYTYPGKLEALSQRLGPGLERAARAAMQGLLEALADAYPPPEARRGTRLADRLVLPGLALFTDQGYRRGRRHWRPMSAYMGDTHVVITGASGGLGFAAAMDLARRGSHLTLVMRDATRAQQAVAKISESTGNRNISYELADLSLLGEVEKLVDRLLAAGRPIDVLINNAGALFNPRAVTPEGVEQSLALLLLSPVSLTTGLLPLLRAARSPRVINVVSGGMYSQKLAVAKLEAPPADYSGSVAYARCKRALMVVTEQWADAWAGDGIAVNAMHPGWADTPGVETSLPGFHKLMRSRLRSPEEGADTIVWLAVASEAARVSGGLFLDREPRDPYLLPNTRESAAQRKALAAFLEDRLASATGREGSRPPRRVA